MCEQNSENFGSNWAVHCALICKFWKCATYCKLVTSKVHAGLQETE